MLKRTVSGLALAALLLGSTAAIAADAAVADFPAVDGTLIEGAVGQDTLGDAAVGQDRLLDTAPSTSPLWPTGPLFAISVQVLERQGDRGAVMTSASLATFAGHAAPINVGSQQAYPKDATRATDPVSGDTTTLVSGTVATGFHFIATPHEATENTVALNMSLLATELERFEDVDAPSAPGVTVQKPVVKTKLELPQQWLSLRVGEEKVLTVNGYEVKLRVARVG